MIIFGEVIGYPSIHLGDVHDEQNNYQHKHKALGWRKVLKNLRSMSHINSLS